MPNRVNRLQVEAYKKRLGEAGFILAVGYPKLNVKGMDDLRGRLAGLGAKMLFVRNRLVNIALRELGQGEALGICQGQTAFVWGEDPVAMARFLVDFKKERPELQLHGALLENSLLDSAGVLELSKSPTKGELKSIISGQALSRGGNLSSCLLATGARLASQIKNRAEPEAKAEDAA
ncbi:MAG: 50S ribosomal protein L10 [Planctomycetota bacterium]|jgi:large subunit ribosomal protein L10|nr:50S ribosomal protein L10 [Planctomycetota bacterium]